jgi:hypothetical protein
MRLVKNEILRDCGGSGIRAAAFLSEEDNSVGFNVPP